MANLAAMKLATLEESLERRSQEGRFSIYSMAKKAPGRGVENMGTPSLVSQPLGPSNSAGPSIDGMGSYVCTFMQHAACDQCSRDTETANLA